ncbi:hypothetical protein COW20_15220 [bacterium (Candidatus Blackallbacteria) CG13_big_fil_rev_8_21_14_2_50_49_14]|nr:MAG: hypothetical protein COW64_15060 [bacterium (Candidatus Blackallbacteria) CG18_big_fil_WC_8_21_14_2_50_49_26]PIW46638.1 MAG: hypothetical protein COW20_15220 [bacterium (Candidatus Blackallbacteria) CG13_big_fil_rev_8_21_14_2_50_49_14]
MTDYFDPNPQDLKVLITVKTYPTLSTKYAETVCTAGITDDGKWIRLYPIPFRQIEDFDKRYPKYSWVDVRAIRRDTKKDFRVESFQPIDINQIKVSPKIPTAKDPGWSKRRALTIDKVRIYDSLDELIADSKRDSNPVPISLAMFKPTEILDFTWKPDDRTWNKGKVYELENQLSLFDDVGGNLKSSPFKVVDKLPFTFKYKFKDSKGKISNLIITDWETGMLYWKSRKSTQTDEEACQKVKQRYFDDFIKKDIYFYMGTVFNNHLLNRPNPFSIIGVFYPPFLPEGFTKQLNIFEDI